VVMGWRGSVESRGGIGRGRDGRERERGGGEEARGGERAKKQLRSTMKGGTGSRDQSSFWVRRRREEGEGEGEEEGIE
jgi:hypothetical protein